MEVDLVTEEMWEGENCILDDSTEDILNFDGERCGICMDVVIDRGVLDCCQHWFCFACIDNWATITSLCPLCQNEFQLITCVPVYDTVGGCKTDEDTIHRDDDWFIEGKNNTLSFPSYYIDENAVVCLDEDGCKIRSGSVAVDEDLDVDTSIACDSCDKWYHAFCVGFDPEGTCDSSWLCPRCAVDDVSQKSHAVLMSKESNQPGSGLSGDYCQAKSSFSERVSISVADDGETAIVISLLEGNQRSEESRESLFGCDKDMKNTLSSSISNNLNSKETLSDGNGVDLNLGQQEMELTLFEDGSYSPSLSLFPAKLRINTGDANKIAPRHLNNRLPDLGLDYNLGSSALSVMTDLEVNDKAEDNVPGDVEPSKNFEEYLLPVVSADKMVSDKMEILSVNSTTPDEKETIIKVTGAKRKRRDRRNDDDAREASADEKFTPKKIRPDRNYPLICMKDQTAEPAIVDISAIVQGTNHRSQNQHGHKISSNTTSKERESAVRLRLKKIMRRTDDDKDSSALVQELRRKIREAVRDKSSEEPGKTLFDPKLLEAFRAALAGSVTENMKPTLDMKAKRKLLQKGKVRENLTKKIYGTGGKRRRAWTRECEVEFWKHRCIKATKPEKIQTLNSVLDQLRDDSGYSNKTTGKEEEAKVSILSRLYLADTSVFPRKNDIQPVSALNDITTLEQKREIGPTENASKFSPIDHSDIISSKNSSLALPLDVIGTKKSVKTLKAETGFSEVQQKRLPEGSSTPASGAVKVSSKKETVSKVDITKGDKRKWALEVLARKTASSNKNAAQEKDGDSAILKGNYSLLAQLPKEMQPVLAPCRHNKISIPVRQAQLYRLAEHFLKKVNPSSASRTAESELAVADAVNIEKEVADRSNSKLVYVNLCSQELLRRSDGMNSDRIKDLNPCSTSEALSDKAADETNCSFSDLVVEDALRNAGLMSDSPPNSPTGPVDDIKNGAVSAEKNEDEGPDDLFEVDSHPELDIYGDFEYNLEDDDFIGAGGLKISELQPEPKIKVVFSSLNLGKTNGTLDLQVHEGIADFGALKGSSDLLESQNKPSGGSSVANGGLDDCLATSSLADGNEEPSLAECEELYGPDKEPLLVKYPNSLSTPPVEQRVTKTLLGDRADAEKESGQAGENHVEDSNVVANSNTSPMLEESSSCSQKRENVTKKEKKSTNDTKKQSKSSNSVMHKVEAYIKEHVRPLCKSGVITVEQYRWAVQKTTEKVMRYHSKEKNANFLIKEGEKVKKLAEQYAQAAQKAK